MRIRIILASLAVIGCAGAVLAQTPSPVSQRQTLLKEMGAAAREPGLMLRNQQPFELAKVQAALRTFAQHAKTLPGLFPAGSFTGETAALPIIETQRAEFQSIFANLDRTATEAQTSITNEASFRTNFPTVAGNCGTCHRTYRRPQT